MKVVSNKIKPSKYQQAVYLNTQTTNKHLAIEAGPGSGKTTTIIEASKLIPYNKTALFLAFNSNIVKELKERLPESVHCSTLHSLGNRAIRSWLPGELDLDRGDAKKIKHIEPFVKDKGGREKWATIFTCISLIRKARATMTPLNRESFSQLADDYAIDASEGQINIAIKAMKSFYAYNDGPDIYNIWIDYEDMIEMPVRNKSIKLPTYDYVFVDEAQDLSKLDKAFIKRIIKPVTGRRIAVGDPKQSIYGFRGSDPESFEELANEPNTIKLPLSICYRSTKAIVRNAQRIYPDIEPFEGNEEGIEPQKASLSDVQEGDMVLCRNTKPLIYAFLELIQQDKKAYIVGKEIEKGLLALLAPYQSHESTLEIKARLDEHLVSVANGLKAKGINKPQNHPKYCAIEEKLQILYLLFDKFSYVHEVETFIELIFEDDDREGIRLMTIHKSKGLENDRVFVIETFEQKKLIPSTYAVTKNQLKQEKNLHFVAWTRAKKELYYIML